MQTNELTSFNILDIIRIKRTNIRIKTENKDCYVISCRIHGESTFFFDGKKYTVKKGDVLYLPYGSSYVQECKNEELICFHLNVCGYASDKFHLYVNEHPDKICSLFENAASMWQKGALQYKYYCMSDLYKIIALTNAEPFHYSDSLYGIISSSVEYLQSHMFDVALSLDDICHASHISKACFIRHFRDIFHCTPGKYINIMRINKAKTLLKSTLYTREEIAFLCGFNDVKYFYVVFKKFTGCTTNEYLKQS